ncbi:hypothetical protein ACP275_02G108300 [Erythranthe tilingii]
MFKPSSRESSQLGFDFVQTKLRRIVSRREQLKIAFDPLHYQIRTGLLELKMIDIFMDPVKSPEIIDDFELGQDEVVDIKDKEVNNQN